MEVASFFYVHENYLTSLNIINYALWKCTDEKIDITFLLHGLKLILNKNQDSMLKLTTNEKLCTVLKMFTISNLQFSVLSSTIPPELHLDVHIFPALIPPKPYAHFLRFLCYYHLHDLTACTHVLLQLQKTSLEFELNEWKMFALILLGTAYQVIGEKNRARELFIYIAELDECNHTSATLRLSTLN